MFQSQRQGNSGNMSTSSCSTNYTNYVFSTTSTRMPPGYNTNPIRNNYLCCVEHRKLGRRYREPAVYRRPEKFITKFKRRPAFSTQQILELEKIFHKKPHVNRQERRILTERLNVNEKVIKLWFKNRRQISGLRNRIRVISDSSEEETENHFNLDYVQSRINKPDEFGYVTLDDRAMKELITVIDLLLTDVDLDEASMELKNKSSLNYEPISPVSIHENSDENMCFPKWELYEPEESLRRLFDVQALITK